MVECLAADTVDRINDLKEYVNFRPKAECSGTKYKVTNGHIHKYGEINRIVEFSLHNKKLLNSKSLVVRVGSHPIPKYLKHLIVISLLSLKKVKE